MRNPIIPNDAKKLELEDVTVDFFLFEDDENKIYYFDTSISIPPEPMINAMLGLELIANSNDKLIMINHSIPNALFPRISLNYNYEVTQKEDLIVVEFTYKQSSKLNTDFKNNKCSG